MRNFGAYLSGIIMSLLLVFTLIGTAAAGTANYIFSQEKLTQICEKNEVIPTIRSQLEKHYKDKYNSTGIPAEVYTSAISEDYIRKVVSINISAGFETLSGGKFDNQTGIEHKELDESIDSFFNDYADSIGYEKDTAYEEKLAGVKKNAYKTISEYCDVYKFSTLESRGLLGKASKLYRYMDKLLYAVIGAAAAILLLMLILNLKEKRIVVYWAGVSAVTAGVIGIIPSVYLIATKYFDAFVIKQPQIFTAFTKLMYGGAEVFLIINAVLAVIGAVLLTLYGFSNEKKKAQ